MTTNPRRNQGVALVTVLLMILVGTSAVVALLAYGSHSATLTRRALDFQRAQIAAEAGLDYGIDQLLRQMRTYQFSLTKDQLQGMVDLLPAPPAFGEYDYTSPNGAHTAFKIRIESEPTSGTIPLGTHLGLDGRYQRIVVSCGAYHPETGTGAVVRQQLQALSLFLIRFGVFYGEDLEILPGPTMNFDGPVHVNSDLYLGGPLNFNDRLTSVGDIYRRRKDKMQTSGTVMISDDSGTMKTMIYGGTTMDSQHDEWMTQSLNRWDGNVRSGAHGVSTLEPPINPLDEPHDIIERALPTSDPGWNTQTEDEKFSNKAGIRIHVSTGGSVSVIDYHGANISSRFNLADLKEDGTYSGKPLYDKHSNYEYEMDTEGSIDVTQTFRDTREGTTMAMVDIYVDELQEDYPELFSGTTYGATTGRGVVYVTRDDPDGTGGVQPAVRLRNGRELPNGGLSVATDLPIYVEGNYNVDGTTKPALVTGDAVTLLSSRWQDAKSNAGLSSRTTRTTEYNAVVMTGNTATIPFDSNSVGEYNGGLENVLRFLEKWSGNTVKFRGSIIDIWKSEIADSQWSYGSYYKAPVRNWGYDSMYRTIAPPGMPRVFGIEEIAWAPSSWEAEGWD